MPEKNKMFYVSSMFGAINKKGLVMRVLAYSVKDNEDEPDDAVIALDITDLVNNLARLAFQWEHDNQVFSVPVMRYFGEMISEAEKVIDIHAGRSNQ